MRNLRQFLAESRAKDAAARKEGEGLAWLQPIATPEVSAPEQEPVPVAEAVTASDDQSDELPAVDAGTVEQMEMSSVEPDAPADIPAVEQPEIYSPDVTESDTPSVETTHETVDAEPDTNTDVPDTDELPDTSMPDVEEQSAETPEVGESQVEQTQEPGVGDPPNESDELPDVSLDSIQLDQPDTPVQNTSAVASGDSPSVDQTQNDELPDVGMPEIETESPEAPAVPEVKPVGFQGYRDAVMTENQADAMVSDDPAKSVDERREQQFDFQRRSNEDLVSQLSQELGPTFDDMRENQVQAVHDYVQEQQMLAYLVRTA